MTDGAAPAGDVGRARRRPGRAAAICGALAALPHIPLAEALGPGPAGAAAVLVLAALSVVALGVGLSVVVGADGPGATFKRGWALGAGYFAVSVAWIVEPFFVDIARHGWMAPFAIVLMAGGLALFWGLAAAVSALAGPRTGPRLLALAGALALVEWLRSWVFTGFPWGLPAYLWIDTGLAQALAWLGPFGLTLLVLALAAAWALAMARPDRRAWALALTALAVGAALALDRLPSPEAAPDAPVVRVVQSGAPQAEKWNPEMIPVYWRRHLDGTGAGEGADLTIWSEVSLPYLLEDAGPILPDIARAARGAPVILGAQRMAPEGWKNSLVLVEGAGDVMAVYDKVHLVPFGEYLPFDALLTRWGLNGLAANAGGGFTPGAGRAPIPVPGIGPILPLICYEAIFPAEVRAGPRPRLMVVITNDSWFGTWAGPQQHFDQARARAIELGVPLARSAQTGISAIVDARGRVVASLPLGAYGHVEAPLPAALPPTPYARFGDWPALLAALAFVAAGLWRGRRAA